MSCGSGGSCSTTKSAPELVQLSVKSARPTVRVTPRPAATPVSFAGTARYPQGLVVGLDVGSTTVKYVVIEPVSDTILAKEYQRHDTRQPEKCLEMLRTIAAAFPDVPASAYRMFVTGSGGSSIGGRIGAKFVQEVNAVSLAVEKLYPDVESVVELGGQDAKIIIFKTDETTGRKKKIPSMNDKCAGGTGAVIDKITAKLGIPAAALCRMGYHGLKLHAVAGKCGVFAETDINGLQKQGVPANELMASLFESIVLQNLAVLTRGHTLRPRTLLLGGPNCYIDGLRECWQQNLRQLWDERGVPYDAGARIDDLVTVPEDAQYFAAIGAVEFAKLEIADAPDTGVFRGTSELEWYLETGRVEEKQAAGGRGLWNSREELDAFRARYTPSRWSAPTFAPGTVVQAFAGVDGGSTSTKGVLLDLDRNVIATSYRLSKGNPIEDTMDVFADLEAAIASQGCTLEVLGVGTTGYAKDTLKDVLQADVALVETVAHTQAGLHFYPDTDVIVDVGGQDIKLIVLKNGQVKDFKLNTQCSAGNGYFLQSTAATFGYDVREFAEIAFSAQAMPSFGYGCAVFMQSDIVDFQRQGWAANEIMAGLCDVLPKNIWLYISQIPNLAKLGTRFVLQGGTQHNLAAVKAQVDFITSRFLGTPESPQVTVHKFCGEAGAIGSAVEAHRLHTERGHRTSFIGLERTARIAFRTTRSEATRCYFCKNKCLRTFIDVQTGPTAEESASASAPVTPQAKSKVPRAANEQRLIIATCEKGTVEDIDAMKEIKAGIDALSDANPNFAELSMRAAFAPAGVASVADVPPKPGIMGLLRRKSRDARAEGIAARATYRIGMPRALNMYSLGPWFMAYFESLGVLPRNLVWSDHTSDELYKEGAKRGAIDPCFPSKIGIPHVHNLLVHKHAARPLDVIFFPMIDSLPTFLEGVTDSRSCPTVAATPEAVKAAFTKERDLFGEAGLRYLDTFLNFAEPALLARQMHAEFASLLEVSAGENARACTAAWAHLNATEARLRAQARDALALLEATDGVGVVLLSRPYHHDPGVCHEIPQEFQKLGIPVFTADTLPRDPDLLEQLFGDETRAGHMRGPLAIDDAWKNSYSENTNRKVWAAKYAARHPNLVALELSSFKCGHDAPVYSVVEEIVERSGTPYFSFKDIDENKPTGAIRLRVETIAYFLRRYRETLIDRRRTRRSIDARLVALERELRGDESNGDRVRTGELSTATLVTL
ncbi:BadF/BadG/BcrA/BcrD ATPase family protein [Gemmatimonas sp.]|uniref:BadF/BadG/BcrA/BcrD ATPase family protein n=1 Tax=Gemmatimonas sp. TaxID=1962908 RepID=UPI0039839D33